MKYHLFVTIAVIALLLALAAPVEATTYNFQDTPGKSYFNFTETHQGRNSYVNWYNYTAGNNNMLEMTGSSYCGGYPYAFVRNRFQIYMTYAAATWVNTTDNNIRIGYMDGALNVMQSSWVNFNSSVKFPCKIEVYIAGGTAYVYQNGIFRTNTTPMNQNPSYITFGNGVRCLECVCAGTDYFDDIIYGDTENRYIFGQPETEGFVIINDQIAGAGSGLAFAENNTIVNSFNMTSTWTREAYGIIDDPAPNQTVVLQNLDSGTNYAVAYTGSNFTGYVNWDLRTALFDSGAPYGSYVTTIPGSLTYSNPTVYMGAGANVEFDKELYNRGDTARLDYTISSDYWDTSTYSYKTAILSATTGQWVHNESLSAASWYDTYDFPDDAAIGVYYGLIIATDSAGHELWLGLDYAEISEHVVFSGWTNDAINETTISGVNITIIQGDISDYIISAVDGNYTTIAPFITGESIVFNVTKTGYEQYNITLAPQVAKMIDLNFTMVPLSKTYRGLAIGGVARDGINTNGTITDGYGRPIKYATIRVKNSTTTESYDTLANFVGWYLCDFSAGCTLVSDRPYDEWGEKVSYINSPNYTVTVHQP